MKTIYRPPDGAEVERLRRVRRDLKAEFGTIDALWDHLLELEKKRRARGGT